MVGQSRYGVRNAVGAASISSANPAGTFGAPETEPGASAVDGGAEDELTRISFHKT
jgi:hypothetical protein